MAGIQQISSSLFIQSGSVAQFKSGITTPEVSSKNSIFAQSYSNITLGGGEALPTLLAGSSSDGTFEEWETTINTTIRLSASGDFNHYSFIEKQDNGWGVISSGSQNGLVEKSYVDITKSQPGVYEYLVLAMSTSSKQTVVVGTTVKVV